MNEVAMDKLDEELGLRPVTAEEFDRYLQEAHPDWYAFLQKSAEIRHREREEKQQRLDELRGGAEPQVSQNQN